MRRGQTPQFFEENGKVIGINLGADFCAEHEWGIKGLRRMFGINFDNGLGVEKCIATKIPLSNIVVKEGQYDHQPAMVLICVEYRPELWMAKTCKDVAIYNEMNVWGDMDLAAAWDEASFGILVRGKENIAKLKEIYQMFLDEDVAIGFAKRTRMVFENPGLLIRRKSSIPQAEIDEMMEADLDHQKLLKEAKKTKVEDKLKKAGKKWMALSPRWANEDELKKTKYKVVFWLNPWYQSVDNYGWFTVESLLQWIDGKGPIPMRKEGATK